MRYTISLANDGTDNITSGTHVTLLLLLALDFLAQVRQGQHDTTNKSEINNHQFKASVTNSFLNYYIIIFNTIKEAEM